MKKWDIYFLFETLSSNETNWKNFQLKFVIYERTNRQMACKNKRINFIGNFLRSIALNFLNEKNFSKLNSKNFSSTNEIGYFSIR